MSAGFQIFQLQSLSYLLVNFDQTCIKILGLESSILIDILSFYIAFPISIAKQHNVSYVQLWIRGGIK